MASCLKFVRRGMLGDHLAAGWVPLHRMPRRAHKKAVWLVWDRPGCPVHPDLEKRMVARPSRERQGD
jgi:hypothetical protein